MWPTVVLSLLVILGSAVAEEPRELEIGGLFDLTGGGAVWGKSEKNAFILACRDFETAHPGLKVKPVIEDTLFSNRQTVTALHKLISIDKIHNVVGATWETTVAMMPICEQRKVVCISPSYHGKEYYARPWRYNFTAWFDDRGYSSALAREIQERGHSKVAIFAALTPYYDSLVEDFRAKTGATVVSVERVTLEERDLKTLVSRTPQGIDAVLMLLDNAGQIQAFLKQWSELRKDRPVIVSDDLIAYLDPPDDVMRYGFTFYYAYPVFDPTRQAAFNERYKSVFHELPRGSSASVAYDETMLLLDCMARDNSPESVRECVAATSGYRGVSGTFSFDGGQTVTDRTVAVKQFFSENEARPVRGVKS